MCCIRELSKGILLERLPRELLSVLSCYLCIGIKLREELLHVTNQLYYCVNYASNTIERIKHDVHTKLWHVRSGPLFVVEPKTAYHIHSFQSFVLRSSVWGRAPHPWHTMDSVARARDIVSWHFGYDFLCDDVVHREPLMERSEMTFDWDRVKPTYIEE